MKFKAISLISSVLVCALLLFGAAEYLVSFEPVRVPGVPRGAKYEEPWGKLLESTVSLPPDCDILVVSGGGAKGAFSAGVLAGWPANERPDFDLVTGVSIGSVVGTLAYCGPDYQDEMDEMLGERRDVSEFSLKGFSMGAVQDDTKFREFLAKHIDQDVLDRVAQRHKDGARLLVGTTNLDKGELRVWDMGAIASSGHAQARQHFLEVLVASCSVPVVFPPVYFPVSGGRTEMHVDGGMMAALFLPPLVSDSGDFNGNVYVLVNHHLGVANLHGPVAPDPGSIGITSLSILQAEQMEFRLEQIEEEAERLGLNFHFLSIPTSKPHSGDAKGYTLDPSKSGEDPAQLLRLGSEVVVEPSWSNFFKLTELEH